MDDQMSTDDVERQLRAWADAAALADGTDPVTPAEVMARADTAPAPAAPRSAARGRRWLAAAAVLVVVVGAAVVVRTTGNDGNEPVRTGEPGPPETEPSPGVDDEWPGEVVFEVLHVGLAGDEPMGTIRSARTAEQLAGLWADLIPLEDPTGEPAPLGPPPAIDFDGQVVVSLTIPDDSCPPTLERFEREHRLSWRLTPVFVEPPGGCDDPLVPKRFVVALGVWSGGGLPFLVHLPGSEVYDFDDAELLVRPSRPEQVLVDLELPETTVEAGGRLAGTVVVSNGTGSPIRIGYCISEFAVFLQNDDTRQEMATAGCAEGSEIPTGMSTYDVTVFAHHGSCPPAGDPPGRPDACPPGVEMPPLPTGVYETLLMNPAGLDAEAPPVTVTIT